jgi:hypothetical protein
VTKLENIKHNPMVVAEPVQVSEGIASNPILINEVPKEEDMLIFLISRSDNYCLMIFKQILMPLLS